MKEPICTTYSNGYKEWRLDGKLHRVDGPAYVSLDGHKEWWHEGRLHRVDGPAVEWEDGTKAGFTRASVSQ